MSEASKTCNLATSEGSVNAISSPASECGVTPCASPDGPMTDLFGREVVLALRSASLERKRSARSAKAATLCRALDELATSYAADAATHGLPMPATYGRRCGDLSAVDAQYACLVSRLREATEKFGSRLFVLRWKSLDTVFGLRASMLRASGRRTSGSDCTSWPTPDAILTPRSHGERGGRLGNGSQSGADLSRISQLAAWPTPNVMEGGQTSRGGKRKGEKLMGGIAQLAAWPTPQSHDERERGNTEADHHHSPHDLSNAAVMASWATPCSNDDNKSVEAHLAMKKRMGERDGTGANRTAITSLQVQAKLATRVPNPKSRVPVSPADSGPTPNGSGAVTGSGGQLNPGHSRWLMGCRLAWQECNPKFEDWRKWQGFLTTLSNGQRVFGSAPCAAMVMRSARRSRKRSLRPISK